jgi:hypothetical protein
MGSNVPPLVPGTGSTSWFSTAGWRRVRPLTPDLAFLTGYHPCPSWADMGSPDRYLQAAPMRLLLTIPLTAIQFVGASLGTVATAQHRAPMTK